MLPITSEIDGKIMPAIIADSVPPASKILSNLDRLAKYFENATCLTLVSYFSSPVYYSFMFCFDFIIEIIFFNY